MKPSALPEKGVSLTPTTQSRNSNGPMAMGMELFLEQLHGDLKSGRYKPRPSRRKLIPKPRQPGKFRPLGIPTVRDRVVQCAVKNILEPIFGAGFLDVSYGFLHAPRRHAA